MADFCSEVDEPSDSMTKNLSISKHYKAHFVRFEIFTAVTMENVVFWDVT
jgi:hypothetical protein